ncbi:extracellular solute-binding protein [Paenibacillus alkaliterrae]|uniref:extracellular solute-binding protein n=1 Tax=Paenibacillus alkaliterrae TaxID=320909 RepID=UPI001F31BF34|nr:extracellular solute-binding protein [Paenibacillus alkaliterrae]MCF2937975.1 extracellular solute-binding protein [Paenibacillus alkaliterrae]
MIKKVVSSVLISTLLAASLAACGSSNENASNSNAATPTNQSHDANEPAAAPDPLGKYEQPVTVTEVIGYRPPEDAGTPKGITPEQNAYLKDLKEAMNIEIKYLWAVPSEQFEQKFSLALATGDLPDVMQVDTKTFEKLKKQDMLADMTDAYNNYATPELKEWIESDGGFTLKTVTSEGKILGIPSFEDPYMSTQLIWIRKDWLKNLNLEAPKTIDELEKVAEAFVNNDPDKNGKDDTYGIAMQKALIGWGFDARGLFNGFGSAPKSWLKGADGKLAAGEIQPEAKEALAKLQSWYQKGIIDQEFALKDETKMSEDITAGKVGITYGEWWVPNWPLNLNMDKDPNAEWEAYQIPGLNGPGKSLVGKLRLNSITVVNKKFEHPEAAVKMINFYNLMLNKENFEKNKAEDGYVYNWFQPRIYQPNLFDVIYDEVNKAIAANQDEIPVTDSSYRGINDVFLATKAFLAGDTSTRSKGTNWGLYASRAAENGGWGLTRKIRESGQVFFNEFYGLPTPTQLDKGSQLDKLIDETYIKIIMGDSLSEFDKFVSSWKKLGGDDITNEVNEWYEKEAVK